MKPVLSLSSPRRDNIRVVGTSKWREGVELPGDPGIAKGCCWSYGGDRVDAVLGVSDGEGEGVGAPISNQHLSELFAPTLLFPSSLYLLCKTCHARLLAQCTTEFV